MSEEEYEPIYYPVHPPQQSQQPSEGFTPTWELPNGGDYASSDGYRSLMAFNGQQRTAGKPIKRDQERDKKSEGVVDFPHGVSKMVSVHCWV